MVVRVAVRVLAEPRPLLPQEALGYQVSDLTVVGLTERLMGLMAAAAEVVLLVQPRSRVQQVEQVGQVRRVA